jgi:hypothetical protein
MRKSSPLILAFIWLFIFFVETYDIYLTVKFQNCLYLQEKNPIGRWLIDLDNGDVALFVAIKVAAIIVVLASVPLLFMVKKKKLAVVCLTALFFCKVALLLYLETGHLW